MIEIENLGKRYDLRRRLAPSEDLRHIFERWARAPFRRFPFAKGARKADSPKGEEAAARTTDFWALREASLSIESGEVVGVIGRNGAGKSTLLKLLSRITEPTTGRIRLGGRVASLLEVGTGFHPELTGRENIFLNGAILGMSRREIKGKFDEIVAFAEVEQFLEMPVKYFSSGMYVRLAFAVAAHLEPEILIIDEVLAVGDAQFQKKCLGRMQDVASKEGRTVLFVSHNMGTISALCQRGVYLKQGRIEFVGDAPATILRYIDDGRQGGGEMLWADSATAPGNERLRLCAVRVCSDGRVTADVSISHQVRIELEYEHFGKAGEIRACLHLVDALGTVVLVSSNFAGASLVPDPWTGRIFPPGRFVSRCTFPADFLNEGRYSIHVLLLSQVTNLELRADDVASFNVHETGEMRREYFGVWHGLVRPKLAWETSLLD